MTVILDGSSLTADELLRVAREREPAELAPAAVAGMRSARELVERVIERGDTVYGLTTGVGVR